MIPNKLRWTLITLITIVWAINFVAGLFIRDYEPDPSIGSIFMGTVGVMLAMGSRGNGDKTTNE